MRAPRRSPYLLLVMVVGGGNGCGGAGGDAADAMVDAPSAVADGRATIDVSPGRSEVPATADAPSLLDGAAASDASIDLAGQADGGMPDSSGPDGGVRAPCSGDPAVLVWNDGRYGCGSCESDMVFPLVCRGGYLACATSYQGSGGLLVTVPKEAYVLDGHDSEQCAYMQPYYYPGFGIWDPREPDTAGRDPALPIRLQAISSYAPLPATFRTLLEDRTRGEAVIRSLVTLTDVARGTAVGYTVGAPFVTSSATAQEHLDLVPIEALARGARYRLTIYPGDTQQLLGCHTFGRHVAVRGSPQNALTAPETTEFHTAE